MSNICVYFLYQNVQTHAEVTSFLQPYCQVKDELINFPLEGIKTKDLYFQIGQRLEKNSCEFLIIETGANLEMFDAMKRRIAIDFDSDHLNYRRKVIAKDPFLRAIGKSRVKVLDVSAGLGIDAVFLAQHGHEVTAVERNPLLFVLLNHAQKRSEKFSKLKLNFEFGDAVAYNFENSRFDCIYYDPMFPDKGKTALPKQEMVLFRQLIGGDLDSEGVLEQLMKSGTRVVVKRPSGAPPIKEKPNNSFESKLIRFDIYEGK